MTKVWNRLGVDHTKIGGGTPLWVEHPKKATIGGLVLNELNDMEIIHAGSPIEYDYKNKTVKALRCWEVKGVVVSGDVSTITLFNRLNTSDIHSGLVIMKMPTKLDGKGKAAIVENVRGDRSQKTVSITVPTADIDTIKAGDYLVESAANSTNASAAIYCVPTNLSLHDIIGGAQSFCDVPRGMKYIYENLCPKMPDIVKANIEFVEWDWYQEIK